jgi:SAM-dependent methyltransferase
MLRGRDRREVDILHESLRGMTNWAAYFENLRHDSALYRVQSVLYVESLTAAVEVHRGQRVLDFGCGFGFVAALLAPRVGEIWLWDSSPGMRSVAERTTAAFPNVRFCDLSAARSIDQQPQIGSMHLILVNSVTQYMTPAEVWQWLVRWRELLAPGGKLVLSDLIPPQHSGLVDIADLLWLGARHGSPLKATNEALGGLVNYWRTRRAVPLNRIGQEDLSQRASEAGLDMIALPRNLTHFSKRWTAVLSPRVQGA